MSSFKSMVSMELDDEEKIDTAMPIPMPTKPDYPYGLKICLTQSEMKKLGVDPDEASVGDICHGHFIARVTSTSADGENRRVELQIEDMALESEEEENDAEEAAEGE